MDDLVPIMLFVSVAASIVGVTKIISDGRTRRLLIQAGAGPEVARAVFERPRADPARHSALKWGLVTAGVGLGLILNQFLPYGPEDPILYGVVLLGGALGLLGYYGLTRQEAAERARDLEPTTWG